jgi:hypothetical protein
MPKELRPLTDKEQAFVEAFSSNGYNRSDAVRKAGYSTKDPATTAYELLQRPVVQNAVAIEKAKKRKFLMLDELDVIEGLHKEATSPKARPSERIQAWVHIGKHYGMFQTAPKEPEDQIEDKRPRIINYNDPAFKEEQMKKEVIEEVGDITDEEASNVLKLVDITNYADNNTA